MQEYGASGGFDVAQRRIGAAISNGRPLAFLASLLVASHPAPEWWHRIRRSLVLAAGANKAVHGRAACLAGTEELI